MPPSRDRDERGGASSIEATLLIPVLMLILFGGFQAAVWWHARQTVHAAAQAACEQARTVTGGDSNGAAERVFALAKVTGQVSVVSTARSVTCTATGTAEQFLVLPGLGGPFSETVTMPKEGTR